MRQNISVFFVILALFAALASSSSAMILAGVMSSYNAPKPPYAPAGVTATAGDTQNTVSWTASAVDGTHDAATSYTLYGGTSASPTTSIYTGSATSYTHTGLTNGTPYYYRLTASNLGGASGYSSPDATATPIGYATTIASASGVVSYWRHNDTLGAGTLSDAKGVYSATANSITFAGSSLLTTSSGSSGTYNGTSSYAALSSGFNWERTQAWTVEFLIKPNITRSGTDVESSVFSKLSTTSPFPGFEVDTDYNNPLVSNKNVVKVYLISDFSTSKIQLVGSTDLVNGTVYHVAVTYDGSSTAAGVHIYVNGVEDTKHVSTDNLASSILTSVNPTIGARQGTANRLSASLQELAVYNVALSSSTIAAHAALR